MPHLLPNLTTPADLFRKAEDDLAALESDPGNSRIAFNLFVTIEHIQDWLGEPRGPACSVRQNAVLRTISHIANGSKHFGPKLNAAHSSVAGTSISQYSPGYVQDGYWERRLTVHIDISEQSFIGDDQIDACELARRALAYWRPQVPGI